MDLIVDSSNSSPNSAGDDDQSCACGCAVCGECMGECGFESSTDML